MKTPLAAALLLLGLQPALAGDFDALVAASSELKSSLSAFQARSPKASPPVRLQYEEQCMLRVAADYMGLRLRPDIRVPTVRYASEYGLEAFQRAVKDEYGAEPPSAVINLYLPKAEEIWINDESRLYTPGKRYMDASVLHEYVHFLQYQYRGDRMENDPSDSLESEAVKLQFRFIDEQIHSGSQGGVCPVPPAPLARPKHPQACILKAVAGYMGKELRPGVPLPEVRLASETTLAEFHDSVEGQWEGAQRHITNVYSVRRNRIHLLDEGLYYQRLNRAIDDSLAHEYVHYVQHRYGAYGEGQFDDSAEMQAIDVQTWFRDEFIRKPGDPCR
ncbi:MAG TPA: hypothetical protein DCM05_00850 [Elusimicrobia bacterium]|nr:hypothetical protein [Elusimicrobiota bacterium]